MKTIVKLNSIKTLALLIATSFSLISCENSSDNLLMVETKTILFTSNNSDGNVNIFNVGNLTNVTKSTLTTSISAADGIYYDGVNDVVVQASRSTFGLEGYTGINLSSSLISANVTASLVGTFDMTNPREMAVNGNFYVIADSADADGNAATADGRLFVYTKTGANFILRNVITTNIKLWGIIFVGNDLYAVADNTNMLAVYNNFLNTTTNTTLAATKTIAIEGIVRTHGLTFDAESNTMILTDIGLASNTQDDGGFHVIENFSTKFNTTSNGGTLALSQQKRVAGSNTMMGNPVDVAYDGSTKTVYIAEAGNNGGRILAFNNTNAGGNIAPIYNTSLASASAVYLYKE